LLEFIVIAEAMELQSAALLEVIRAALPASVIL
jgi:hypothetical protein